MAETTKTRWNARKERVSILHHAYTGVWIGEHDDPEQTGITISHPKLDEHCFDYFMNGALNRIPAVLPDQADDTARDAIAAALEAMERARPAPEEPGG